MAEKIKTYKDIQDAVFDHSRQDSDQSKVLNQVKLFINARYLDVAARQKWRWRREERVLPIIGKYTTGTVSVTNGSRSITFGGTADITAEFKYRKFFVSGDNEFYRMISVDAAAETAVLDAPYQGSTSATANFTIFKDEYGLWPDFEEFDDIHNPYGRWEIERIGPWQLQRKINKYPRMEGAVRFVTTDGEQEYDNDSMGTIVMGYDFMGAPVSKQAKVFPHIADKNYLLPITYIKKIVELDADTDEPMLPVEDRTVLVYGALADLYQSISDNESFTLWEAKFERKMAQMLGDHQEDSDKARIVPAYDYRRSESLSVSSRNVDYGILFDTE